MMCEAVKNYTKLYENVKVMRIEEKVNNYLNELGKKLKKCCQCSTKEQKCEGCKVREEVEIICEELMKFYEKNISDFLFKGDPVEVEGDVFHFLSSQDEMAAAIASAILLKELEIREERKWEFRGIRKLLNELEARQLREEILNLRKKGWRDLQNYAKENGIKVLFMVKLLEEKLKVVPRQMWVVWLRGEKGNPINWVGFVREKREEICEILKLDGGGKKVWQIKVEGIHSLARGNGEVFKLFQPTLLDDLPFLKEKFWYSLSTGRWNSFTHQLGDVYLQELVALGIIEVSQIREIENGK